jgi:hypothetical protein
VMRYTLDRFSTRLGERFFSNVSRMSLIAAICCSTVGSVMPLERRRLMARSATRYSSSLLALPKAPDVGPTSRHLPTGSAPTAQPPPELAHHAPSA